MMQRKKIRSTRPLNPENFAILGEFGHITRLPHDNIEGSVIMTGLVEGTRNRERPRTCWIDNIVAWTDQSGANLKRIARDRGRWSALTHPCSQPSQSNGKLPSNGSLPNDFTVLNIYVMRSD